LGESEGLSGVAATVAAWGASGGSIKKMRTAYQMPAARSATGINATGKEEKLRLGFMF
jgi:hypothetical protein